MYICPDIYLYDMGLKSWFVIFAFFGGLCACSKDTTTVDNQRTSIEQYITNQSWENVEYGDGVYRYVLNRDRSGYETAPEAQRGDQIVFNYSIYVFSASGTGGEGALIYTNNPELQDLQEGLNATYWSKEPMEVTLGRTSLISGLSWGLNGVRQGDTLKLFMSSDRGYGDKPFSVIPANTPLVWNLGIQQVIK